MKIHEYQAKKLLDQYGLTVQAGDVAETPEEAVAIAEGLLNKPDSIVFIKAQVHAGGRGKAGGIKSARNLDEVRQKAGEILGMRLINKQTGAEGKIVRKVLVVRGVHSILTEMYVGIVVDRQTERPVIMVSRAGGMEIEEVAAKTPELIIKETIHPLYGLSAFQARKLTRSLGLEGDFYKQGVAFFLNLYRLFLDLDCSQVEINPLITSGDGHLIALDAKLNFDDSGLFRHKEIKAMRDLSEESALEVEASKYGLNYIKLDGNIGCMVNGAGLAMATMDIIKYYGQSPANFLDVGGGANEESITAAFKILLADTDVKAVLVNIFGGIVRCDRVARGIIGAVKKVKMDRPLVVRLKGTNSEEGNRLLAESGLKLLTAEDMADAAQKVIAELPGGAA